jgi:glutathione synthase/RimK-type ligase-like ATP-grasp enzyme
VLAAALRAVGHEPIPLVWGRGTPRGATVVVRSTWDYVDRLAAFGRWLDDLDSCGAIVHNSTALIRWNLHKGYLIDLDLADVPTVPTLVLAGGSPVRLTDLPWDDVVLKPAVSASARRTVHTRRIGPDAAQRHLDRLLDDQDVIVQPYLASIADHGEVSVIVVDGTPTHAIAKRPAPGDWRVQRELGGTTAVVAVTEALAAAAAAALDALPAAPTFARVDLVRGVDDRLLVIEIELIEPELWFDLAPDAATRLAEAVTRG